MMPSRSVGALCGIAGPSCFVAGWLSTGSQTPGYSPRRDPISDLARIGAPHRIEMTAAFFVFGVAMLLFAPVLAKRFHHSKLIRCAVTLAGVATLGVAA